MKKKVAILCGGRSFEHKLSIVSTYNIIKHIDLDKYEAYIICIDFEGNWHLGSIEDIYNKNSNSKIYFDFSTPIVSILKDGIIIDKNYKELVKIDVIFPITNGVDGHQGALPGLFELYNIPYVGSAIFETVVCIDKEITKSLLENYNIKTMPYLVIREENDYSYEEIIAKLGEVFFIKPCRLSSSAGISRVKSKDEFKEAFNRAKKFDNKFLLEKESLGREIECGIIGNDTPIISPIVGEVVSKNFYTYEAKYESKTLANVIAPAIIEEKYEKEIKEISKIAYKILGCKGFARIDFFLEENGDIYVNEATTMPLFTNISMFPKLWDYKELINKLIEYAFE